MSELTLFDQHTVLLFKIFWVFFKLSLISVGGVFGLLPDLERTLVTDYQWITHEQFIQSYVISQFVPGPNMAMCPLIGYMVAGWSGWWAGFLGIYSGPFLIMGIVFFMMAKYENIWWVKKGEMALRPLVAGLLAGSAIYFWESQSRSNYLISCALGALILYLYQAKKLDAILLTLLMGGLWTLYHFLIPVS